MPLPPVAGFVTVTWTVPEFATADAGTEMVSCPVVTYVVGWAFPFQLTVAFEAKLLPFTVSIKAAAPAFVLPGFSCEIAGMFEAPEL